jgi:sugar phosphate isomerase/epimerase
MRVGIQISSVREYLQNEHDVLKSFQKISRIGCKDVQIQWISPDVSPKYIKSSLNETNLNCVGIQDYYDEIVPKLNEIIKMNELWSGKNICVSRIPERYHSYEGCMQLANDINKLIERIEDSGQTLSFHPISSDYVLCKGKPLFELLLENVSNKLQVVLDVYHVWKSGYDAVDWIEKLNSRIEMIHFKDAVVQGGKEMLTPVGQGSIEWDRVIATCVETGVKYCFAEQERWQKDPFECLKESYDYIISKLRK